MAQWFRFDRDYDDRPRPRVMLAYRAGHTLLVPEGVAARAARAEAGEVVPKPGMSVDVEFQG
jgi:hypothetical protein